MVKGAKHSWYDWDDDFIWLRLIGSNQVTFPFSAVNLAGQYPCRKVGSGAD